MKNGAAIKKMADLVHRYRMVVPPKGEFGIENSKPLQAQNQELILCLGKQRFQLDSRRKHLINLDPALENRVIRARVVAIDWTTGAIGDFLKEIDVKNLEKKRGQNDRNLHDRLTRRSKFSSSTGEVAGEEVPEGPVGQAD